MAFRTLSFDDGRGSLVQAAGRVDAREVLAAYEGYFEPERVRRRLYVFADFTALTELAAGSDIVQLVARAGDGATEYYPRFGAVAVVGASDLAFGMARMWEGHVSQRLGQVEWSTSATRSRDEATRWLCEVMRNRHGLDVTRQLSDVLARSW